MLHSAVQAPGDRPVVADLWTGEQLTLFALRDWSRDAGCTGRTECVFRSVFGLAEVERAIDGMDRLMTALATRARRPFQPYCAVCNLISPQEVCVLNLVAAAQSEDEAHMTAAACWLAAPAAQGRLAAGAGQFASCLKSRQLYLPVRAANGCWRPQSQPAAAPGPREAQPR